MPLAHPLRRFRAPAAIPLSALTVLGLVLACTSPTSPGSNCDPGAGFNFALGQTNIVIDRPGITQRTILVQRDTAQGEVRFDVLRGIRRYGSGAFQDSLGLFILFTPNPAPPGSTQLAVSFESIGADDNVFENERMAIRGFIGSGLTAKECFREITVSVR